MAKPLIAKPVKNPDFEKILAGVIARYPKALAYLAGR